MASKSDQDAVNQAITDMELERGEHPIGQLVHISTVTHAWRGVLVAASASYYFLSTDHPYALVDSTGKMADYIRSPTFASDGDEMRPSKTKKDDPMGPPGVVRVCRGACSWMISWPL